MSIGTKVYAVRLPDPLKAWLDETRVRRNNHSRDEPWDLSEQIRVMLVREMKKMKRSRSGRGRTADARKKASPPPS